MSTTSQASVPPSVAAVDARGHGIQIRFSWDGDRFAHVIERLGEDQPLAVLTSVESESGVRWPNSPPIQQISVEQIGSAVAALGVGSAGQGHWSISVLAVEIDGRPALQFDVAARAQGTVDQLGSHYHVVAGPLDIRPLGAIAETDIAQDGDHVFIRPRGSGDAKTYRWAYAVVA